MFAALLTATGWHTAGGNTHLLTRLATALDNKHAACQQMTATEQSLSLYAESSTDHAVCGSMRTLRSGFIQCVTILEAQLHHYRIPVSISRGVALEPSLN